ncbi:translation initiation factor eIF-2B epsilon subunit, GEF [Exophiala dermatitidis]|uniref:Mannose-1-phosphate guanyltransferase n=2 Tax=Exophiala dermatitidis TaxID=5970 RepID=H6C1K1_EXODN|nr:translation initiation factor eIF-2B epsilon subunit [Exophiala dermatitidis NIH/UT8656]KAJ4510291.1 translation initiation factor eIF-2B epsilon subunit, GEF [Exophiala dermatitidis]EHY58591.1 translation initiation factor eIF-2B epsilon subunit [Exophiala dermatitidis NIH/UT8656]KAJ4510775.1 translation initiation factor eIF-2B epsilon subunit, GEF [Exophiala dermatitidis]KAJ4534892.1 translation initiation factor eIF-2B epsilon subunit, GEF [Exophiala dermatitidis]KAJ4545639.1 translatio
MPPKNQKAAGGKGRSGDDSKEDPLTAVVVADTFETRFAPFTVQRPRCLLPLANTPLIDYTLEYLASSGVQVVYFYPGAHADQVEAYLDASRWRSANSPFESLTILRCIAGSVGDVMRDLDQKHLIAGDFLVISGDVISNFPIEPALRQHKERREKDKNAIMTMVLREAEPGTYDYSGGIVPTFVLDPSKNRCLHYEESFPGTQFTAHVDPEILKSAEIDVRQDLIDCRVDICTPDVLSLWSDNFDNQAPRKDFLFGVLKDYELNGKTIHTYIVKDQYASRAADFWFYNAISRDFKRGMVTSIAVENNVFGDTHYERSQQGYVVDRTVIRAKPTELGAGSIVGPGSSIGAGCDIRNTVIGQRCHVGKGTVIDGGYIWDDASIGNNVKVSRAIIGNEAFVGDDCTIEEGALISYGVKIAPGTTVPAGSRICNTQQKNDALVGGDAGEGHAYIDEDEDDYFASRGSRLIYEKSEFADSISTLESDLSDAEISSRGGSRSQSFATSVSDEDPTDRFQHDTVAILVQRMQEGKQADDMLSELMGLRFSGGADETQVRRAVAVALMKHIHSQVDSGVSPAEAARRALTAYNTLIRRKGAQQATEAQVAFLLDAQRDLIRRKDGGKTLLFVLKDLYDLEIFGEEAFTEWWADERSSSDPEMAAVRQQSVPFIEWLENAESESESESEEDDE